LKDDHSNARFLAEGLSKIDGISIDLKMIQTNIIIFDIAGFKISGNEFVSKLREYGVKALDRGGTQVRMVTHRGIEREDVQYALEAVEKISTLKHT
jgi:threonine aldolase